MNIVTKPFTITRKEFKQVCIIHYYSTIKSLIIILFLMTLLTLLISYFQPLILPLSFMLLIWGVLLIVIPHFTNNSRIVNKLLFQEKTYRIDNDFLEVVYEDGSYVRVKFENFIKAVISNGHCLIYYTSNSLECFSVSVFYSESDYENFINILKSRKILLK